ncbi:hypothetical protein M3Y94_00325200 [Aphelenchoides besseyi]|nr:hypothetical protein M3Y94_00325200 [Aphelenchoides besseyi]
MCYEEHRKKFPNEHILVTEISKKCSEKWKTMNEMEKKRFNDLALQDAERYQAEVLANGGQQTLRKRRRAKKRSKSTETSIVVDELSAFFFFSNERRGDIQTQYPSWKVGQIAQELGRAWKSLSDEERRIYEKKASEDKERYNEEMRSYRANGSSAPSTSDVGPSSSTTEKSENENSEHSNQQTVQLQYLDQDGNVIRVITQPAYVNSNDGTAVYMDGLNPHENSYENA